MALVEGRAPRPSKRAQARQPRPASRLAPQTTRIRFWVAQRFTAAISGLTSPRMGRARTILRALVCLSAPSLLGRLGAERLSNQPGSAPRTALIPRRSRRSIRTSRGYASIATFSKSSHRPISLKKLAELIEIPSRHLRCRISLSTESASANASSASRVEKNQSCDAGAKQSDRLRPCYL